MNGMISTKTNLTPHASSDELELLAMIVMFLEMCFCNAFKW